MAEAHGRSRPAREHPRPLIFREDASKGNGLAVWLTGLRSAALWKSPGSTRKARLAGNWSITCVRRSRKASKFAASCRWPPLRPESKSKPCSCETARFAPPYPAIPRSSALPRETSAAIWTSLCRTNCNAALLNGFEGTPLPLFENRAGFSFRALRASNGDSFSSARQHAGERIMLFLHRSHSCDD